MISETKIGKMTSVKSETPEKSEKAKKTDKDLDVSNAGRGVWLVKVPKFIADRWSKADPSSEVGKLKCVFKHLN